MLPETQGLVAWLLLTCALAAALGGAAAAVAAWRQRQALLRVAEGLEAILAGNDARRIVVATGGPVGRIADGVNALAERSCVEREERDAREDAHRRLLANISHDLRTPLTSIAGYADALARGIGDDPDRYLQVLSSKTAELSRLTDDLFYLTRMDAGDISLETTPTDIAEEVSAALLGFEHECTVRNIAVDVVAEAPCRVIADPSAIRRILGNLVSNALRHATGMTRLEVSVTPSATGCTIEVADDGAGFTTAPERLFERGVAEGGGSGLGLAIVHGLATRMGATLQASSEPGVKTSFRVTFRNRDARA
jgi:signal transduction histidine kinase